MLDIESITQNDMQSLRSLWWDCQQKNPERYNQEEIFPNKVRINREYVENYRFYKDIKYILRTIMPQNNAIH